MSRETLYEIGLRHDTDKPGHQYLGHYDTIFGPRRDEPLRFLEIGINNRRAPDGGSLRMWRDYFPNATLFGMDCIPEKKFSEGRIEQVFIGLQGYPVFLQSVVDAAAPFDIIVDDGSHCSSDHLASFSALWPHINPGGWYCIEDCVSIFNDCWTQPGERTILDLAWGRMKSILTTGLDDINEVRIIGDGPNDGLVMFRKRATT